MKFTERLQNALKAFSAKQKEVGSWRSFNFSGSGEHQPRPEITNYLAQYEGWVYANVSRVANSISSIPIKLMKSTKEGVEEEETHQALELLYKPNPYTTKTDFIKMLATYIMMAGEGPIRFRRKNPLNVKELPYEMYLEEPNSTVVRVGVTEDHFEILLGYKLRKGTEELDLQPHEMILINTPNPSDKWRGMGIIEAAIKTVSSLNNSENYNLNFFKNAAVPAMAIYTDQVLSDESYDRLKENIVSEYSSTKNAHNTMILEAGLKVEKLQNSAKDMDFVEQQRFMRDKLMAIAGTTKALLGITEDVNRANAEASEYIYAKYTLKPMMQQIVDYLNEYYLPIFDSKGEYFFTFEDPTPENVDQKINMYDKGCGRWLTPNDIRQEIGKEDIEGGDVLAATQPSPTTEPAKETKAKYLAKVYKEEVLKLKNRNLRRKQMVAELKNILMSIKNREKSSYKQKKYGNVKEKAVAEKYIQEVLNKAANSDKKMLEATKSIFDLQEKQILAKLGSKSKKKGAEDYMFDQDTTIKASIKLVTPAIEQIILEQGAEAFELLGVPQTYKLLEEARRYLNKTPEKFVKSLTATAYERVRSLLAEGLEKGEGAAELGRRIREYYGEVLTVSQSELIARTEVSRATGFAQIDAFKQSGVVSGKEWVVTHDDRLCGYCAAMPAIYKDRVIRKLNESFFKIGDKVKEVDPLTGQPTGKTYEVTYENVQSEPLHPHCRCVVLPVLEPIKSAKPKKKKEPTSKSGLTEEDLLNQLEENINERSRKAAKNTGDKSQAA